MEENQKLLNRRLRRVEKLCKKTIHLIDNDDLSSMINSYNQILNSLIVVVEMKEMISSDDPSKLFFLLQLDKNNDKLKEPFLDFIELFVSGDTQNIKSRMIQMRKVVHDIGNLVANFIDKLPSTDSFHNPENSAFSYGLKSLQIKNYQSLKNIEIPDIPVDTHFIVFTGDNGQGKTSILQAIAIAMFGNEPNLTFYNQENTTILLEAKYENKAILNEFENSDSQFLGIEKNSNFVAYGASRLQLQSSESQDNAKFRKSNIYGIFRTDSILLNIEYWLKIQQLKGRTARIEAVKKLLIELMPSISEIRFENPEDSDEYLIQYIENNTKLESEQLSAGNKSILAMIGDMMIRLYDTQSQVIEPKNLVGIVAIDELETHLHPKWQKEFPRLLANCFPKVQFIITTHSAIVFLGMPPNSTFFNISRDENHETTVKELDIDIQNILPNQILTSALFDMENIRNVHNQGVETLSVETDEEIEQRTENEIELRKVSVSFKFQIPNK